MTSMDSLVTLVPLTIFFLYKVISSSTKNSPSTRVMRNLTQAAREVPLYFRVHVMSLLSSFPSDPLYSDFPYFCILIFCHPCFPIYPSICPSSSPPLLFKDGALRDVAEAGCEPSYTVTCLMHKFRQLPYQPHPFHVLVCSSHSHLYCLHQLITHISYPRGPWLSCQLISSLFCALRWTALTSAVDPALLASGATPASAVTSITAASKSSAPRHRNSGLTTMDIRRARVGEGHTVRIREVEDWSVNRFQLTCITCLLCARQHAKCFQIFDLI